jgi:hypothetical protein
MVSLLYLLATVLSSDSAYAVLSPNGNFCALSRIYGPTRYFENGIEFFPQIPVGFNPTLNIDDNGYIYGWIPGSVNSRYVGRIKNGTIELSQLPLGVTVDTFMQVTGELVAAYDVTSNNKVFVKFVPGGDAKIVLDGRVRAVNYAFLNSSNQAVGYKFDTATTRAYAYYFPDTASEVQIPVEPQDQFGLAGILDNGMVLGNVTVHSHVINETQSLAQATAFYDGKLINLNKSIPELSGQIRRVFSARDRSILVEYVDYQNREQGVALINY